MRYLYISTRFSLAFPPFLWHSAEARGTVEMGSEGKLDESEAESESQEKFAISSRAHLSPYRGAA